MGIWLQGFLGLEDVKGGMGWSGSSIRRPFAVTEACLSPENACNILKNPQSLIPRPET